MCLWWRTLGSFYVYGLEINENEIRIMSKSRINLRGLIFPQEVLLAGIKDLLPGNLLKQSMGDKGIPIRIYGTIENPKFSFR